MYSQSLQLKSKMDRPFLIQRLQKPMGPLANVYSFGGEITNGGISREGMRLLQGIFSFDYMGSAEFENGAVSAALEFIAREASKKNSFFLNANLVISGNYKGVYYICPKSYEDGVKETIDLLLTDEHSMNLLETTGLRNAIDRKSKPADKYSYSDIVGWLELDNGFFMFIDEQMFAKTKRLFGVK